jgi:hypothetical protein
VNALVFLGIAAVLSAVGCGILWLRSRQPGSMEAHIEEFARELDALAPGAPSDKGRRPGPRNIRGGLDRLPDSGAGPERPERPKLPPEGAPGSRRGPGPEPGPERPLERGRGPERPLERGRGPERPLERGPGTGRPGPQRGPGPERPLERGPGPERPRTGK